MVTMVPLDTLVPFVRAAGDGAGAPAQRATGIVPRPHPAYHPRAMPKLVINGAMLKCSEGLAPSTLTVLPVNGSSADEQPAATVMDNVPMVNIAPFGMCKTLANPQVAAATAAAMGALTPMPCLPVIPAPWSPGASIVTIQSQKALTNDSKCNCMWTGSIEITDPGTAVDAE